MSTDSTPIFDAALSLPQDERADLAHQLLKSLKPQGVLSEDDSEFASELDRRVAAYESGETTASDWDAVSARLHQVLDDRRAS